MKQLTGLDTSFLNLETSTSFGHINSLSIYQRPKAKKDFDCVCFAFLCGAVES